MDRGAWGALVHGVAKSQARLSMHKFVFYTEYMFSLNIYLYTYFYTYVYFNVYMCIVIHIYIHTYFYVFIIYVFIL